VTFLMNAVIEFLNQSGGLFIGFAGMMLLQSSVVILVIFAADELLRNRVRAVIRYFLWLLVLLKFVLPPSLALPSSPAYWLRETPVRRVESVTPTPGYAPANIQLERVFTGQTPPVRQSAPTRIQLSRSGWALVLWVAAGTVLVVCLIRRSWLVRRLVAQASAAPDELNSLLESAAVQLGVRRRIGVRLSDGVPGPALCGLFRPVILMPTRLADKLSASQLRAVFLHELAHFKRGDLWINHVQTLLQIVYWWHPLLWLANARIRHVREEAVDETVLVTMAQEADAYPETLLDVAKLSLPPRRFALGLIGIMESKSTLGQRIRRMVSQPLPRTARMGLAGAVVVVAVAVIILPLARRAKEPSKSASAPAISSALATHNGRSIQEWFDQYDSNSNITFSNQVVALQAIRKMGTNAVPFLREKLAAWSSGQTFRRPGDDPGRKAAWILSQLGSTAEGALAELISALNDGEIVPLYAAMALGNLGPKAGAAVPALFESLRLGNGQAAKALVAIAPDYPDLLPTLIDVLQNGNEQSLGQPRINAAMALGRLGKRAVPAIPALRDALKEQGLPRISAVQALRRIASDRADVMAEADAALKQDAPKLPPISELIAQLQSGDSRQKPQTIQALGNAVAMARFSGTSIPKDQVRDQILPLFSEALDDRDPSISRAAGNACGNLGTDAEPLLPKLLALAGQDGPARGNVLGGLQRVAPGDKRTLPVLLRALDDVIPQIRQNAAATLREFGPEAREAVPGLQRLLNDNEPWVRFNATIALWNIARQPPSIPVFVERLKEDDNGDFVPLAICKLFGEMGPAAAKEGLPTLHELLTHWNPKVREQARAALEKVNPADPAIKEKRAEASNSSKSETKP
jgi:beta-lactamase regulating signal transducer with metallopeptidase domain/HEAT repeat protein